MWRTIRSGEGLVRLGLAVLAALNLGWGAWALLTPYEFFTTFPGIGHHWTAAYPPYNEHLVTDLGATFLTLGVLLAIACVVSSRDARAMALVAVTIFNIAHLSYHALHRGTLSTMDYSASLAALAAGALLPLGLLALVLRRTVRR
jgi:hypothetical protein